MAESTLSLARDELREAIGYHAGYTDTSTNWSTAQANNIDRAVKAGLRQFYLPPQIPGEAVPHRWSFMTVTHQFQITAAANDYDLPDDFGSFQGNLHYDPNQNAYAEVVRTTPDRVLAYRGQQAGAVTVGRPWLFAVSAQRSDGDQPQRFLAMFWPDPDGEYELWGRYTVNPDNITASKTYPLGGQPHGETIRMSSIDKFEEIVRNNPASHWHQKFLQRLQSSVWHDRRVANAEILGPNKDMAGSQWPFRWRLKPASYAGTFYNGT